MVPPSGRYSLEAFLRGAAQQDRLSAADLADPRIPNRGTPSWATLNLRAQIDLDDEVTVRAANREPSRPPLPRARLGHRRAGTQRDRRRRVALLIDPSLPSSPTWSSPMRSLRSPLLGVGLALTAATALTAGGQEHPDAPRTEVKAAAPAQEGEAKEGEGRREGGRREEGGEE